MKKQLLAVAVASLVSVPVLADGDLTGSGVLIWTGSIDSACGWSSNEANPGDLGFGDWAQSLLLLCLSIIVMKMSLLCLMRLLT
ncbi:hypothetical protein JCM19231_1727 [Vibrio ishigakensis]|uniref:Uncharacterized protein n=1 Tax=Vibrio ishigakensis TaxID=1481914 RepID=A0A0B8P823_9VIBR|nr:hypothetical protein JCM19231_1727 [Vibrio ishigakensis]